MTSLLTSLLTACLAADAQPTSEVRYTGTLVQIDPGGQRTPVKNFDVVCLLTPTTTEQSAVMFLVNEDGGGGVAWPERFGHQLTSFNAGVVAGPPVQLLYRHRDIPNLLELPLPLFAQRSRLAEDAEWTEGEYRYTVIRAREVAGRPCWQVEAAPTGRGRSYTVHVEQSSGVIVDGVQRLTMGQGEQFELNWRSEPPQPLAPQTAQRALAAAGMLLALQAELGRSEQAASPALSPAQIQSCLAVMDQLQRETAETPFARLAAVISRDVQAQQQRAKSVEELAQRFVGQPAPEFALTSLDGKPIAADAHRGKTLVLHLWDYRDEPLEEPYGQIGYLDFLLNRHGKQGVVVYGVSVDRRLRDPSTAGHARRSARKLKTFMNLGYEIAADHDGAVLKAFGDPTQFDEPLPLWIVIGPDGKVAHFRTGFYEVDRERGLKELDDVVSKLVNLR
jgi:peroxiredoxin